MDGLSPVHPASFQGLIHSESPAFVHRFIVRSIRFRPGVASDQPGSTYWGEFSRGEKEGLGIGEWDEGSRYVGQPGPRGIASERLAEVVGQHLFWLWPAHLGRPKELQGPIPECQEARCDSLTSWRLLATCEVRGSIDGLTDAGNLGLCL